MKKAGWEKEGGWYWETVYRTNTMSAFNAGRAEAFDEYEPEFLEFIGIEDFRQTPVCASRSGIVKKRTDVRRSLFRMRRQKASGVTRPKTGTGSPKR